MMPLWKVIEVLEEMSCNPDIHNTEAIYTAAYYLKGMQNFCRNFGQLQRDLHHKTNELALVISEMQKAAEEGFTNIIRKDNEQWQSTSQQPCDDEVSRDCDKCAYYDDGANDEACDGCFADEYEHPNFKPKTESDD